MLPDPELLSAGVHRPKLGPTGRVFESYTHALSPPKQWRWTGGEGGEKAPQDGTGGVKPWVVPQYEGVRAGEGMDSVSAAMGLFRSVVSQTSQALEYHLQSPN